MKPKHVFVTYIQTDIDSLWAALTEPDLTEKYFHNTRFISNMKVGDDVIYENDEGPAVSGQILEIETKSRLVFTFKFNTDTEIEAKQLPFSRVTYELEKTENAVKFTLIHDDFESNDDTFNSVGEGWPLIISGLKTMLETNKPLNM